MTTTTVAEATRSSAAHPGAVQPNQPAPPAELPGAIWNAMRGVEGGKTAILNVVLRR